MADHLAAADARSLDDLIPTLYRLAVECEWQDFRSHALREVALWSGAVGGAWLTRSDGNIGEFSIYPPELGIERAQLIALNLAAGDGMSTIAPVPPTLAARGAAGARAVLAERQLHRGDALHSVLLLYFTNAVPSAALFGRALRHLAEAGALSLHQYIQRDEWLLSLGRTNRGSAAVVDSHGTVYAASSRFRDLVAKQSAAKPDFARLPFAIPAPALEGDEAFFQGPLHFRISPLGNLFQLHARRPLPLDGLSPREQQIARALGNGKTFKSVARQYDIAVSTVANHASRIYRKLGIYRREDLVDLVRRPPAPEPTVINR
ncbi:MAG: Regulatory protein luxR family [Hydrocarboniphaga sp.]|uniref:helix-turn-helix transcriptional regulator n=1 Tax=Hydrocarboniphaga sp. TaxID=2033016 RepID=UPI00260551B9|nr:LuxR C-terminal-related transcriptional regulator [Hydrocarboniphaga sp.]MDB5972380.1 Regulatory protein luxR family [Hydrocarboniphaga sp.]